MGEQNGSAKKIHKPSWSVIHVNHSPISVHTPQKLGVKIERNDVKTQRDPCVLLLLVLLSCLQERFAAVPRSDVEKITAACSQEKIKNAEKKKIVSLWLRFTLPPPSGHPETRDSHRDRAEADKMGYERNIFWKVLLAVSMNLMCCAAGRAEGGSGSRTPLSTEIRRSISSQQTRAKECKDSKYAHACSPGALMVFQQSMYGYCSPVGCIMHDAADGTTSSAEQVSTEKILRGDR